jgi:hypothetical protein
VTDSEDVLRAALEAAGLPLEAIPEEQRGMFTSLTEEEVTRLITLCAGQPATAPTEATVEAVVAGDDAPTSTVSDTPIRNSDG